VTWPDKALHNPTVPRPSPPLADAPARAPERSPSAEPAAPQRAFADSADAGIADGAGSLAIPTIPDVPTLSPSELSAAIEGEPSRRAATANEPLKTSPPHAPLSSNPGAMRYVSSKTLHVFDTQTVPSAGSAAVTMGTPNAAPHALVRPGATPPETTVTAPALSAANATSDAVPTGEPNSVSLTTDFAKLSKPSASATTSAGLESSQASSVTDIDTEPRRGSKPNAGSLRAAAMFALPLALSLAVLALLGLR